APYLSGTSGSNSNLNKAGNIEANYNTYVLANNVDMTGVHMVNRLKEGFSSTLGGEEFTTAAKLGFGGIFDGRGYSISNVVIEFPQGAVYGPDPTMWNTPSNGFFYNLLEGALIKNVAFLNIDDSMDGASNYGLSGVLGYNNYGGKLENVYVQVSPDMYVVRGLFSNLSYASFGTGYKNVVVDYQRPAGYTFAGALDALASTNHYAYNYGALYGGASGGSAPINEQSFTNVIVASPAPITSIKGGTGGVSSVSAIMYGENETEQIYDFGGEFAGMTIQEVSAMYEENEVGINSRKVRVGKGVERYNDITAAASSSYVDALKATGFFKIQDGKLLWHNQKIIIEDNSVTDFDASEGKILSSTLNNVNDVEAIKYGDVYLEEGVDYTFEDGQITFLTIEERTTLDTADQSMTFEIQTADYVYKLTNVTYWTMVIDDAAELKTALDIDYTNVDHNRGYYKLAANVDMTNVTLEYTTLMKKVKAYSALYGFAGVFDGDGHAIKNATTMYGIFGNVGYGNAPAVPKRVAEIKNLAVTNITIKTITGTNWQSGVFGRWTNYHNYWNIIPRFSNIYVSYADNTYPSGLFEQSIYAYYDNIYLDTVGNTVDAGNAALAGKEYGENVAGKAHVLNTSAYTDGGTFSGDFRHWAGSASNKEAIYQESMVTNLISLGKTPIVYQNETNGNYANFIRYDATSGEWILRNSGCSTQSSDLIIAYEHYVGYASNETVGFFPVATGVKENFQQLGLTEVNTQVGYVCQTCYNEFSLSPATCSTCGVAMDYLSNIWGSPAILTWDLLDLTNYVNPYSTNTTDSYKGSGIIKIAGASKYNNASEMSAAYATNKDMYNSFLAAKDSKGNSLFKVSATGVLLWHDDTVNHDCDLSEPTCTEPAKCSTCGTTQGEALGHDYQDALVPNEDGTHSQVCSRDESHKITTACVYDQEIANESTLKSEGSIGKFPEYYKSCICGNLGDETFYGDGEIDIYDAIDFDASNGEMFTTLLNNVTIDKVVIDGTELLEDAGFTYDRNADKYYITGAPSRNNNQNSKAQLFTITIYSGEYVYNFVNVTYWNMIINDSTELKTALDITYGTTNTYDAYNWGMFKLGNNIAMGTTTINWSHTGMTAYPTVNTENGFAGIFDGDGFVIDCQNTAHFGNHGMFGILRNSGGSGLFPKQPITVKNFALKDFGTNFQPALASFSKNHDYGGNVILENIYINVHKDRVFQGIIELPGACITMNNVVVDAEGHGYLNKTYADPKKYTGVTATDVFSMYEGYSHGTLFFDLRYANANFTNGITNFISIGKASLVKKSNGTIVDIIGSKASTEEPGTYVHTVKYTGWSYNSSDLIAGKESSYGYAGNRAYGDTIMMVGLKDSFNAIAKNVASSATAIAGFYCATCTNYFSLEEGTCACGATLTASDNLWKLTEAYNWKVLNTADKTTNTTTQFDGEYVFWGASKYETKAQMKSAYLADTTIYDSFKTATTSSGKSLWTVYGDGMLSWAGISYSHTCKGNAATCEEPSVCSVCGKELEAALGHNYTGSPVSNEDGTHYVACSRDGSHKDVSTCVYDQLVEDEKYLATPAEIGVKATYYKSCVCGHAGVETFEAATAELTFDELVYYDAFTGKLMTSILGNAPIDRVVVGDVTLDAKNGGLVLEEDGSYTIESCDKAGTVLVGVPYINNKTVNSNVLTFTIYSGDFIYRFTNVNYVTMVIHDGAELQTALDITYTAEDKHNYGFYILGNNVDGVVAFSYAGFNKKETINTSNGGDGGFMGQFDGLGYTIDMKNSSTGSYGLFAAFNCGGSTYPKGQAFVRNFAIKNYSNNGGAVLAMYTNSHQYWSTGTIQISNIFVSHYFNALAGNGLIAQPYYYRMNNVYVDLGATRVNNNYALAPADFGEQVVNAGAATIPSGSYYDGGTIFGSMRWTTAGVTGLLLT
ncbi:MAG: hypothetical protein J6V66_05570, partial [Clostridia bacterium]|nr:hypothetical protein [Clostridia bacterium]